MEAKSKQPDDDDTHRVVHGLRLPIQHCGCIEVAGDIPEGEEFARNGLSKTGATVWEYRDAPGVLRDICAGRAGVDYLAFVPSTCAAYWNGLFDKISVSGVVATPTLFKFHNGDILAMGRF